MRLPKPCNASAAERIREGCVRHQRRRQRHVLAAALDGDGDAPARDTNVVASATFWRGAPFDCLAAWAKGQCEAIVSPAVLAEYQETIEVLRQDYPDRPHVQWVEALTESATLVFPVERATGATPDPHDEMILECALAAEADVIVSGDKKHLLPLQRFRGIPILSPAEFLRALPAAR
jgi:putative PIN family toxin of toxin-antitoxin system